MGFLHPENDLFEKIRATVIPPVGKIVQLINEATGLDLYATSRTHESEFVARVHLPEEEFEEVLGEMGFVRNPLASLKQLTKVSNIEEGSFRYIGQPLASNKQVHVIIYDGRAGQDSKDDKTYVFAHHEYRWDTNPLKHYSGEDVRDRKGVSFVRRRLEDYDVPMDEARPWQK